MVFLSEPDERRLWLVIMVILGTSLLLVFASLQFPWYTASYYSGSAEARGDFQFEDVTLQEFSNGEAGRSRVIVYADDSPFADLMQETQLFVGVGVVGMAGFGVLLGLYYYGQLASTFWIKASWITGFVALVFGITWFALQAGSAGANHIVVLLDAYTNFPAGQFGTPEPKFWGEQVYANGDLVSAPGVGWALAILAVINYAAGTLLLYRFPEPQADTSGYEVDDDEEATMESTEVESAQLA